MSDENQRPASLTLSKGERIAERIDPNVTLALQTGDHGELSFANLTQIMEVAKIVAIAKEAIPGHLRDNVGACLAICIQASEWQMSPFAVANKSYVVKDRMAFEAQLINAVILRRAPLASRFKIEYRGDGPTRRCKVSVKVKDGNDIEVVEYESPEIRNIPVQNSPLWKGDPDQQLFYYSSRAMCRRHFPDVLLGIYTPDEMAEVTMKDITPIPGRPSIGTEEQPKLPEPRKDDTPPPKGQTEQLNPKPEQKRPAPKKGQPAGNVDGGEASATDGAKTHTPPQTGTTEDEQRAPMTEPERVKLYEEVNLMRDKAGMRMEDFRKRMAELQIAGVSDILSKYTPDMLEEVKRRWDEVIAKPEPAGE